MNTDKLVPIDFSRKITPPVIGDKFYNSKLKTTFIIDGEDGQIETLKYVHKSFDTSHFYVISYADRPNTGKQPVDDDVVVDGNYGDGEIDTDVANCYNWPNSSMSSWKLNHAAMVERYQASLPKPIPTDDKGWPTAEQQENINPGINPELAASMVAPVGKVVSGLIVSKQELSAIQTLERFGYKYENGVWSQQDVKPEANTINAATALHVFAGWLTSLKEPITFSGNHWATPAADMAAEIIKINGLDDVIDFDNAKIPSDSVITVCKDEIKPELAAYMVPHVMDSSIKRLGVFLRKNELVIEGEGVIDCVIRELAEKHGIDIRTDEEKLRDAIVDIWEQEPDKDAIIDALLASFTIKGK